MTNLRNTIVAGDTAPDLIAQLSNIDGPQSLVGATVQLRMKRRGEDKLTTGTCVVDSPATSGIIRHTWTAETSVPGEYLIEFLVTYQNGKKQMFPNAQPVAVTIRSQLR